MTLRCTVPTGAVILAGGRSARLGGVPKAALMVDGGTLLARTVAAAAAALRGCAVTGSPREIRCADGSDHAERNGPDPRELPIAVVGPPELLRPLLADAEAVRLVREDPPFSGPAAGLAAGLDALAGPTGAADDADALILVLACDMPGVGAAVEALLAGTADRAAPDGWLAVDAGREQPLAALYRAGPLRRAVEDARASGTVKNGSVFRLVASLELTRLKVPTGCTADVDTWADAQVLGVHRQGSREDLS